MPLSRLKRPALGVLIIVVAIQFYRPARTNPPVDQAQSVTATATLPAEVSAVLKRSCYDCHSNETRWPWYSAVAPMSWGVVGHVNEGRGIYNLSEWGTYTTKKRAGILETMCDEVREGGMPLKSYLLLHPEARLAEADWKAICDWTGEEVDRLR
jgi:hypothetical protein